MICPKCLWVAPFGHFTKDYAHNYITHLSERHPSCNVCETKLRYTVTTRAERDHAKERARTLPNYGTNGGNGFSGWRSVVVREFLIGSNDIEWWVKKDASLMGM